MICLQCNLDKDEKEFRIIQSKYSQDGDELVCEKCLQHQLALRRGRFYHDRHRAKRNARCTQWHKRNPEKSKLNSVRSRLKWKYGITPEDYQKMFEEQGGCCAICGKHQSDEKLALAVDHNHITKQVRALLCGNCNLGIGNMQESPEILERAAEYLREFTD